MTVYSPSYQECFNPRTHMECDFLHQRYKKHGFCFNPRTHMECDYDAPYIVRPGVRFNPRTHMECDGMAVPGDMSCILASIHALTWSATLCSGP